MSTSVYSSVIHKGHSFKIHKIMQNMYGGRKLKSRGSSFDWRDDLKNLFAIHFGGIWFRLCGCTKHKHIIMGPGAKVPNDTAWSTTANLHNLPTWEYGLSCGYYWGWVAESTSKRAAAAAHIQFPFTHIRNSSTHFRMHFHIQLGLQWIESSSSSVGQGTTKEAQNVYYRLRSWICSYILNYSTF